MVTTEGIAILAAAGQLIGLAIYLFKAGQWRGHVDERLTALERDCERLVRDLDHLRNT